MYYAYIPIIYIQGVGLGYGLVECGVFAVGSTYVGMCVCGIE